MLSLRSLFMPDSVCNRCSSLATFILIVLSIRGSFGQDIAFPHDHLTAIFSRSYLPSISTTKNNGIPVTKESPQIECGLNMFSSESHDGQKSCECFDGYFYDVRTDGCYEAHTRGPCENGSLFYFRADKMIAECAPHPCETQDEAFYRGFCHRLRLQGPCDRYKSLVISPITHRPDCQHAVLYHLAAVPTTPRSACPPGTRQLGEGSCRSIF